jgi:hypothetical protein
VTIYVDGLPEPDQPQGYAMTIVLGRLGIRFTAPSLQVEVTTRLELPQLWPSTSVVPWLSGTPLNDREFLDFASGKHLRSTESHIDPRPWRPATELATSRAVGGAVELPAICGKHVVNYPALLVDEAMRGRFCTFEVMCECPLTYLMQTEPEREAPCRLCGGAARPAGPAWRRSEGCHPPGPDRSRQVQALTACPGSAPRIVRRSITLRRQRRRMPCQGCRVGSADSAKGLAVPRQGADGV